MALAASTQVLRMGPALMTSLLRRLTVPGHIKQVLRDRNLR